MIMKDYSKMTHEELEKELAEIIKKNYEKGVVLLDRDYDLDRLRRLSCMENVEDIDAITAIIRSMKRKPDLKRYCKGMTDNEPLIHPIVNEDAWKEKTYDDFVSREEFINRTGIFITPSYFSYIYNVEWKAAKESGVTIDAFVDDYEENNSGEITEIPLHGTFKYLTSDDYVNCFSDYNFDDGFFCSRYEPNVWEVINSLAREIEQIREIKDKTIKGYKAVSKDAMNVLHKLQMLISEPTGTMPN